MQIEITPEYLASQGLSATVPERFWNGVTKTDSCWIWTGPRKQKQRRHHAMNIRRGKVMGVHVVSFILHGGPVPEGMQVLHNCPDGDRGDCVNPDHLWLGTERDNRRDAVKKGTWVTHFKGKGGELCPNHKLTWEDVRAIRQIPLRHCEIAKLYGLSRSAISYILRYETWIPTLDENQLQHLMGG